MRTRIAVLVALILVLGASTVALAAITGTSVDICYGGTATSNSGDNPEYAFDDSIADPYYWATTSWPQWIQYDLGAGCNRLCSGYTLQAGDSEADRMPKNFTFLGSDNASTWDTLDTQTNQTFSTSEKKTYTLGAITSHAYRYYRLNITATGEAEYIRLYEMEVFSAIMLPSEGPSSNVTAEGWTMITDNITEPAGLYGGGGHNFPGGTQLVELAETTHTPLKAILFPLAFGTALLAGLGVFALTHNAKVGVRGSLLVQTMVSLGILVFWYKMGDGVIPGWSLIPFGLEAILLLLWRNPYNPATG